MYKDRRLMEDGWEKGEYYEEGNWWGKIQGGKCGGNIGKDGWKISWRCDGLVRCVSLLC